MDQKILDASAKHPQPGKVFQYGTAGFRMKADLLDSVVFRVGLLAALRSRKLNGQTIGVMITASHNPPEDNGVKLVDPMGEMLESSWEAHATVLANAETDQALVEAYNKLATDLKVNQTAPARVIFARDTRASGSRLAGCLIDALEATGTESTDYKILTTPQLHYLVRCVNTKGTAHAYGEVSEKGYYEKMSAAFKKALKYRTIPDDAPEDKGVIVDCANGVGGPKLRELLRYLPSPQDKGVKIKVVNEDVHKPENLNSQCGADFVKTGQRAPPSSKAEPLERCASLDGDADRVVYYFTDKDGKFNLLDGDRIATLSASFIGELARHAGLAEQLKVGVVQTAYANGASTKYITSGLNLPVVCTPTGVKHLHHAALRFDVGVYFEANGHGTVVFSPAALKTISTHEPQSPAQHEAVETLQALTDLINQTVGDAISDLLLVEVILAHKKWGPSEWLHTYSDLPNRLVRVEVKDRNIFKAVDAERKLESPAGIQDEIDKLVGKYKQGRSFARASGTEDAVRVYAEAETRTEADDLAQKVASLVEQFGA
ncbi:N-acetylglucosamine-phosphate mutase-like protein [Phyllosticta capitalensis]